MVFEDFTNVGFPAVVVDIPVAGVLVTVAGNIVGTVAMAILLAVVVDVASVVHVADAVVIDDIASVFDGVVDDVVADAASVVDDIVADVDVASFVAGIAVSGDSI